MPGDECELQRTGTWEPSDAPWWAMQADTATSWLYAGTHARTVVARDLGTMAPLTGLIGNHTGWVRALAAVEKTAEVGTMKPRFLY